MLVAFGRGEETNSPSSAQNGTVLIVHKEFDADQNISAASKKVEIVKRCELFRTYTFIIPARPSERLACLTILVHQGDNQQEEGEGVLPNSNLFSQQNSWRLFTLLTTKRCPFDEPLSDVHLYESIPPGRNCWETKDCLFLHLPHTVAEDKHSLEPENRVENVQILFPVSEFWDQSLVAKLFIYQY